LPSRKKLGPQGVLGAPDTAKMTCFNTSVNHSMGRMFLATQLGFSEATGNVRILVMSSHMPPVPPANRSKRGGKSEMAVSKDKKLVKHEHHALTRPKRGTLQISGRTRRIKAFSVVVGSVD
jgi:hypothetical protein